MVSAVKRTSARAAAKKVVELTDILSSDSEPDYENAAELDQSQDQDSEHDEHDSEPEIEIEREPRGPAKRRRTHTSNNDPLFQENPLYLALSSADADVSDLALEWLESYADDEVLDESNAITDLFNLVLRCCGCVHLAKNHDMINADSAAATVAELGVLFEKQRYHEYPFVSTNKAIKFFRKNIQEFFESLVLVSHEKGMLYSDEDESTSSSSLSSPMMNDLLSWLTALCSSHVRPFRYVSTSILMIIQTTLCEQSVSIMVSLEKQQRQLDIAKNKKVRNHNAQQRKIDIISESIDRFSRQYETLAEYLGDIFLNGFIRRFRDIDSGIRIECIKALALWMTIHEEYFLQAKYLRYLGWLLSDPNDHVREEVAKGLHKLYKHITSRSETMNIGFRQFTERFKKQFINMIWKETHVNIKLQLFGIYHEIYKLGYFGEKETTEIGLYGFYLAESSSKQEKVRAEWGKLISVISIDKTQKEMEKYSVFLSTHNSSMFGEEEGQLSIRKCLHFKNLADFLRESYSHFIDSKRPNISMLALDFEYYELVAQLFSFMYSISDVLGSWSFLVRYVLCDVSSAKFEIEDSSREENLSTQEDELKERLEINSTDERVIFLSFIYGAFTHIMFKKLTRRAGDEDSQDNFNVALPMLTQYLTDLEKYLSKSSKLYVVFMNLWVIVLVPLSQSFGSIHNRSGNIEEYNSIHGKIIDFFADVEDFEEGLQRVYEQYFALVLKHFHSENQNGNDSEVLSNATISVKIEDLLTSLIVEAVNSFNSKDLIDDADDDIDILPEDQKFLCNRMLKSTSALQKLSLVAKLININNYLTEPIHNFESSLLDIMASKFLSRINFRSLIELWPNNYLKILSPMELSWKAVLDLVLVSLCWKLEDLVYLSNDLSALEISIDLFLDDYDVILKSLSLIFQSVQLSYKDLNENTTVSNGPMRRLIGTLVKLSKLIGNELVDAVVSLRVFYQRMRGGNNFNNFDAFFSNMDGIGQFVKGSLPSELQVALFNVFLVEEAQVAKLLSVSLERGENEDVNIEDFCFDEPAITEEPVRVEVTEFGGSDDEGDDELLRPIDPRVEEQVREAEQAAKLENKTKKVLWEAEKSFYVYVVKLLSLNNGGFSENFLNRLELNAGVLGDFYKKILDDARRSSHQGSIDAPVDLQPEIEVEADYHS